MDKQLLKRFYEDENMRVEVFRFVKQELDALALIKVYKGEDTKAFKEAKDTMIRVEQKLIAEFEQKAPKQPKNRAV